MMLLSLKHNNLLHCSFAFIFLSIKAVFENSRGAENKPCIMTSNRDLLPDAFTAGQMNVDRCR